MNKEKQFIMQSHEKYQADGPRRGKEYADILCQLSGLELEGKKTLVVGSGGGGELIFYAQSGAEVTAIDIDPANVDKTIERARENNVLIKAVLGDAENMDFSPETFDIIFMMDVIEHISDPVKALDEIARVLKRGGHLVMNSANKYSFYGLGPDPHYKLWGVTLLPRRVAEYYVTKIRKVADTYDVFFFPTRSWIKKRLNKNNMTFLNASKAHSIALAESKIGKGDMVKSVFKRKIHDMFMWIGKGKLLYFLVKARYSVHAFFAQNQVIISSKKNGEN